MTLKTALLAGCAALALGAAPVLAEQVRIGIAAEPYLPFASLDSSGTWTGWEIEFADAVCAAAELDCVLTPVAWDGIIPSLTGQQIDVIMASMSITEERMQSIDFTDPYYKTPAVIVADKSLPITPDADGLAGMILGVQASTTHQAYAQEHFSDAVAEIRIYQTQDEANQDLFAGRIDAIQADSTAMAEFVVSEIGTCCEIKGAVEDDPEILGNGVGAGLRKGDDELREKLNAAIATVIADGTRDEINARYFDVPIY